MASSYIKATSKILDKVLASKKGKVTQEEDVFVRHFYTHVPEKDIADIEPDILWKIAHAALSFIREPRTKKSKVRIYKPSQKEQGWDSNYTIIETNTQDMPFLLDSVTEAIKRRKLTISRVIHPIVSVLRDEKGQVQHISPHDVQGQVIDAESFIHFEIKETLSKTEAAELEKDLKRVLKTVRAAVEDWPKMLKKMGEVLIEMSTVQPAIEKNFPQKTRKFITGYLSEVKDFLQWLIDNNFTFLGYVKYDFVNDSKSTSFDVVPKNELGILRVDDPKTKKGLQALPKDLLRFAKNPNLIEITKANRKSMVHRPVYMDYIDIKRFNEKGEVIGEHRFLGLFTSIVYYQSARLIPIIRQKIASVLKMSHFSHGSYNRKELASALEAFPRDELFQLSEEELYETAMEIVTLSTRPRVKLFVRKDPFERYTSAILYVPREKYSTRLRGKIQQVLERGFNGTTVNHYTQITDSPLARLNLIVKTEPGKIPAYDVFELEKQISLISKAWEETLHMELVKHIEPIEAEELYRKYANAFALDYTEKFSAYHAYWDILSIEKTLNNNKTKFDLYETADEKDLFNLKIYNIKDQLILSDIIPILENMGLSIIDEHTYCVDVQCENKKIWIHHFRLAVATGNKKPNLFAIKHDFETTVEKTWNGEIQNDGFNALTLEVGMSWRYIVLIRAYSKYLHQVGFNFSRVYIEEALAHHPKLTKAIIELFKCKFDPHIKQDRESCQADLVKQIEKSLYSVTNLSEDRILRHFVALVDATLRTNFYQQDEDGNHKPYISFKFRSKKVPDIPKPVPYKEIFVYSARVEGIHLRGGKVARGGLRWSDRREDFRTEVLGLVKAQMTKNTVIVPAGSKGGFVVKRPPQTGGREAFIQEGIECYKTFLRGLLDITDNIIDGKIVPPTDVIRYDNDDPYLVVAADKGTATFSDIANAISAEYNFWLGDAFASGGSAGYDHKKMGITAKGAWVSVQRHFKEMGINTQTTDFTVIGIGDMGGDVFGNGMLLSKHIRLVAAFNHMHIFLDPNPNAAESFKERKRLFNLPRSSWEDYNPKLISKGGGVYNRSEKSIKISAQVKEILNIKESSLSPDELIKAILKSPVDLMWNGGIGTYVRAETETNEQVGDKANDNLRITGSELGCKVVGEGGNLGLTQLGRIEYAKKGGRINTDFIDNSAGVDCSDHEVNIKILLGQAIENNSLKEQERNKLLEAMTEDVSELCLTDNMLQAQALSVAEQQGYQSLTRQQRLIHTLEKEGRLDRAIEFLPNDSQITLRSVEKRGFTRPELAVLLSYSKLSVYDNLIESNIPDDSYFDEEVARYFPEKLAKKFEGEMHSHRLKREIITTIVTNSIVNRMGCTFFHSVVEDTGLKGCDIARAYIAARDAFEIRELWGDIEALDEDVSSETQLELFVEAQNFIERAVFWFLRNHSQPLAITEMVDQYEDGIKIVAKHLEKILSPVAKSNYDKTLKHYTDKNVPPSLAKRIAALEGLGSACDIIKVAKNNNKNLHIERVGEIYFEVGARLKLGVLRNFIASLSKESFWDRIAIRTLTENLYDQQARLTAEVINHQCNDTLCKTSVANWAEAHPKDIGRYDEFFTDLTSSDHQDLATLVIAVKRVESICVL